MPATSQQQQKLFGLALSVKIGETPRSEVSDEVLNIVDTMSEKKIKDFAETSHKGLPTKVETVVRNLVRETIREKVLGETVNTKNIGVDTVLNFKDGEVWRVTRVIGNTSNPRGFFVKPHDAKTKKANTSIEIELKPDFLQKNLKSINEATDIKIGDKIKIYDTQSGEILAKITSIINKNRIEVKYKNLTLYAEKEKSGRWSIDESINEAPTRRSKDFFEDDNKYGIELHKLMRGKWDRNKALQYFIKLQSSLKDNSKYQNVLYFIANGLGINGGSYKSTVDLRDDIISTAEQLYKLHTESINEADDSIQYVFKKDSGGGRPTMVLKLNQSAYDKVSHLFDDKGRPKSSEIQRIKAGNSVWDLYSQKSTSNAGPVYKIYGVSGDWTFGNAPTFYQQKHRGNIKAANTVLKSFIDKYLKNNESISEEQEQLDEKLITFSNRAPYGQVVFIAGGAGGGKGFAVENFLDSASFKVRDVDEMKKQLQKLNAIGKLSIQQIVDRFGKNIKPADLEGIKKIQSDGFDLKTMDLKNPNHVYALHILVKAMDIKDKSLVNMLGAAKNPKALPNIMFDITAKEIADITEVLPQLLAAGYKSNNIHLVWVLSNYQVAIKANQERDRVVPADILLKTHIGAGNTIWGLVTKALPKDMNGRVDVVLNNRENTIPYTEKDEKTLIKVQARGKKQPEIVVKSFLSLPVKKQGGSILPEKLWKDILYKWIKDNAPAELTANM
jgi:hypothetical protein